MNDKDSIRMLNDLYQTAVMGEEGTQLLVEKSKDGAFRQKLEEYARRYEAYKQEAASMLAEYGEQPQEPKKMDQAGLWMGVQMNTLVDSTPSHMAEMLIQGGTMGMIKGIRSKNEHDNPDPRCARLEDDLLALQQRYIDDMKHFLV